MKKGVGLCAVDTNQHAADLCNKTPSCGAFTVYQGSKGWIPGAKAQLFNKDAAKSKLINNPDWNTWIKM